MAVREFTDSVGTAWRVWDVTPEVMHPITRSEDYMVQFRDGWLAFESKSEKRRIPAPYPTDWTSFSLTEIEALCRHAAPVVHRLFTPTGAQQAATTGAIERRAIDQADEVRTFLSPRNGEWQVRLHEGVDRAGTPMQVLRFTSGDIIAELAEWPKDWRTATMQDYAVMLLDAESLLRGPKGEGPQRRRDDRRE